MKHFAAFLLFAVLLVSTAAAHSTIFIVRHARAASLPTAVNDSGTTEIYTSEAKRTQQTAAPLAKALHVEPTIIQANDRAALVAKLHSSSGNFLVVGHGNTIPEIINALGIAAPVTIADSDYDNLFVVILEEKPRLIRLHYH